MPNFSKTKIDFYCELEINDEGMECLRLLNEIIADFDELMEHAEFDGVEKIKTIGSTYMAAAGLEDDDKESYKDGKHVVKLVQYAMRIQDQLDLGTKYSRSNNNKSRFTYFLKLEVN